MEAQDADKLPHDVLSLLKFLMSLILMSKIYLHSGDIFIGLSTSTQFYISLGTVGHPVLLTT